MAAIDFPYSLCTIEYPNFEYGADNDVERTPFEDGTVRQAQIVSRSFDTRTISVVVKQSDLSAFHAWLRANANSFVNFRDVSDMTIRDVRIRGGRAGVSLVAVQNQRLDGERFWRGQMTLEGFSS